MLTDQTIKRFGLEIYPSMKVMIGMKKTQESAKMEPEIELFIEPLTGLTIPISLKNKNECV